MARIRTVKPEFIKHHELFLLEEETKLPIRLGYQGLWICADKEGRFKWKPAQLKLDALPYDNVDFEDVLIELVLAGFLIKYEVGGNFFGYIPTFTTHQRFTGTEATTESRLPDPKTGNIVEVTRKFQGISKEIPEIDDENGVTGSLSNGISKEIPRKHLGNNLADRKGVRKGKEGNGDMDILPKMQEEDFVLFQSKLIQEGILIEGLMATRGIPDKTTMLGWIKVFNVHIVGEGSIEKDYDEYRRHFKNWINMQDTSKPPVVPKVVSVGSVKKVDYEKYQKKTGA